MKRLFISLAAAIGLAIITACASTAPTADQVAQGLIANTAARTLATQQLVAGKITAEKDQTIQATCDTVRLGLETAAALNLPADPAEAAALAAKLAALQLMDDKAKAVDVAAQKAALAARGGG